MNDDITNAVDISEQECLTDPALEPEDVMQAEAEIQPEECETDELEALRAKVAELKEELERSQAEISKSAGQLSELYELFPDSDIRTFPEAVWQSVSQGNSLAASYALHLCREKQREQAIKSVNQKNAASSAGFAGEAARGEYFTPSEVRAMSQSEVRANYTKILESMKKWN